MSETEAAAVSHLKTITQRFVPKVECCTPVIDIRAEDKPSVEAVAGSLTKLGVGFRQVSPNTLRAYSLQKLREAGIPIPDKNAFMQALESDSAALDEKGRSLVRHVVAGELEDKPKSGGWHRAVRLHTFGMSSTEEKAPAIAFVKSLSDRLEPAFYIDNQPIVAFASLSDGQGEAMRMALGRMGMRYQDSHNFTFIMEPEKLREAGITLPRREAFHARLPRSAVSRIEAETALTQLFGDSPAETVQVPRSRK